MTGDTAGDSQQTPMAGGIEVRSSGEGRREMQPGRAVDVDEEPRFDSVLSRIMRRALPGHTDDAFKHLQVLDSTSRLLAEAGPDLQAILQVITRQVGSLGVDLCVIRLLSEDEKWLVPVASYHPVPEAQNLLEEILSVPQTADEGLHGYVVQRGEAILIPELGADEMRAITKSHWRAYLDRYGIHSVLVVPLRARGKVRGGLGVFRSDVGEPYTFDDQILVQELADRAALAIENTRLFEQLVDREQKLQSFVGQLLAAQEEERRKVAYDVHDGLAQVAASAHQHLQAFAYEHGPGSPEAREHLDRCLQLARQTIREARRVIANLRPTALDDFGLAAALRLHIDEFRSEGWDVDFEEQLGRKRLPPEIETALFRVAQEAINNARKHASVPRIFVSLMVEADEVRLVVQDWGNGFDPGSASSGTAAGERVGLSGMRERTTLVGGTLHIDSAPGEGTRIDVRVPVPQDRDGELR